MTNRSPLILVFLFTGIVFADGPEASRLVPPGGERGRTIDVTVTGKFPVWPCQVWVDEPGLTFEPQTEAGKFKVTIAGDTLPGLRKVRFYDPAGVSAINRFVVGTVPEIAEVEPNERPDKPQKFESLPIVVNAAIQKRGDVDVFALSLKSGQTLTAALDGNRTFKSPMDAVMQILDPRGFVLAQNHDARALDPQVRYTAKRDGDVLVRVFSFPEQPDTSVGFAGGDNYVYRLALSTNGIVEATYPMAVTPALESPKVWDQGIPGEPLQVARLGDPSRVVAFLPQTPGAVVVPIFEGQLVLEGTDRNVVPELTAPAVATGCLASDGERDAYRFQAAKGTRYVFELESRALGFPLDSVLEIEDATGKQIAREDDSNSRTDSRLVWGAPADGEYRVVVRDVHSVGGVDFYYRLNFMVERPDYELKIKADSFAAKLNEPLEIPVEIARVAGFNGELKVRIEGLPEHVTCDPVVSPASGDASKAIMLIVKATQPFVGPVRIVASVDDKPETRRLARMADDSPEQVFLVAK